MIIHRHYGWIYAVLAALWCGLVNKPAWAQGATLDAVTVTGAPYSQELRIGALGQQSIMDTPFSITALDEEDLREADVRFVTEALRGDPAVASTSGGTAAWSTVEQIQVRGLPLAYNTNFKRNGLAVIHFAEPALEGVGRMEVLKGASGFAYGFAAPGGVVNIIPKKPTDTPYRAIALGYTTQSLLRTHADLAGRFGAERTWGWRINVAKEQGRTPVDKVKLSRHFVSGYLDWRVTPDVTLALDVEHHAVDRSGQPFSYSFAKDAPLPAAPNGRRFNGVDWAGYDSRDNMAGMQLDWRIHPDWSLNAGVLKQSLWHDSYWSLATIQNAQGDFSGSVQRDALQDFASRAAQVGLHGRVYTGALLHELGMGWDWKSAENWRGEYQYAARWNGNLYHPIAAPAADIYAMREQYQNAYYRERGVYLSDTLHLTPRWRLMGGLRHGRMVSGNLNPTGVVTAPYAASATSPMLAVTFQPDTDVTLYASWAQGLERGTTAPANSANAGMVFGALKSRQAEIGVKYRSSHQWQWTLAAYQIDKGLGYTDAVSHWYSQSGSRLHRGLEWTLDGMPTRQLRLQAGVSLIDATMRRTGNSAVDGRRPAGVARQAVSAAVDWEPAAFAGTTLHADWQWSARSAQDAANTRWLPAVGLLRAGLRWRAGVEGNTTVRAHIDNLLNKRYWSAGLYPGLPRTVRLSLDVQW